MCENILLYKKPKIEFKFLDNGFQLVDKQTVQNSGFYSYNHIKFIQLNKIWFLRLAKWIRVFTWICNGVPFFPDTKSCKKASLVIYFKEKKLCIWLTDSYMAGKAKTLKKLLEKLDKK
ncbi:hypothetical protein [uncultured Croceitalea sp.]|uniref:hypothetical protein n=1 Tax=uncultured Croceitalea sp. TaxID=1798908 RepID=UPI0033061A2F